MVKVSKNAIVEVDLGLTDEPKTMARMEIDPDYIEELAQSIRETGLLQPVLLRPVAERFEIVAGHCRFLAHKKLGLPSILALVRKMTDKEAAIARATENLSREGLSALEEAKNYAGLVNDHFMTLEQVGKRFGKTAGTIKRRMDILRMPPRLQQAIHKGQISMSAGEELWPISNETDLEYYLLFAVENGCTKDVAREWCKQWKDSQRRSVEPSDEGGGPTSPLEPRPYYLTCDLCSGPTKLEDVARLTICPQCWETIKEHM